jgi:hypothetical protein
VRVWNRRCFQLPPRTVDHVDVRCRVPPAGARQFDGAFDWDIAIGGCSIADAVAPAGMAHQLSTIVHKIHDKERP